MTLTGTLHLLAAGKHLCSTYSKFPQQIQQVNAMDSAYKHTELVLSAASVSEGVVQKTVIAAPALSRQTS